MTHYLKRYWPAVAAASVFMILAYGLQVYTSLVQIRVAQGLLDGDVRGFALQILLLLLTWLAVILALIGETICQGRAVRQMNNALRRDMAASLLSKSHQEYHKQESGAYLSQFTNDISKIEQMSWTPFFLILGCGCTGSVRSDRLGDDPLDIAGGIGGRCGDHDACTSLFWQTSGKTGRCLCS